MKKKSKNPYKIRVEMINARKWSKALYYSDGNPTKIREEEGPDGLSRFKISKTLFTLTTRKAQKQDGFAFHWYERGYFKALERHEKSPQTPDKYELLVNDRSNGRYGSRYLTRYQALALIDAMHLAQMVEQLKAMLNNKVVQKHYFDKAGKHRVYILKACLRGLHPNPPLELYYIVCDMFNLTLQELMSSRDASTIDRIKKAREYRMNL